MPARYRALGKDPRNPLRARFDAAGLAWTDHDRIPSTRRAHESTEHARVQGKLEPFHRALLRRYWEAGEDISDWKVLRAAAGEAGLDPDVLQTAVEAGTYTDRVEQLTAEASAQGVTGIPTFVVAGKYAVVGAQEYPVFKQLMAKLGVAPRAKG